MRIKCLKTIHHVPQGNNHLVRKVALKRQYINPYQQKECTEQNMIQIPKTHLQLSVRQPENKMHYITTRDKRPIGPYLFLDGKPLMSLLLR
jgi:hypothetical protein